MNKVRTFTAMAAFIGIGLTKLVADPLVQFPVGPAAWTIDVSGSELGGKTKLAANQRGNAVVKVDVKQNDHYRSSTVTYAHGQSQVNWDIPGTPMIMREDARGTPFMVYKSDFYYVPFLPSDFSWVTSSTLQEKKPISHEGKLCFHYLDQGQEAWIDSKTLLPVALDNGTNLAVYTFLATPTEPLELPEKYRKMVAAFSATMGIPHSKPNQ